ncbi:MAG: DUF2497 domain-containing protein [Dongiaceae bacterium]
MSQSRSDQSQSMEEILASIRRIIAEGERDSPGFDPKHPRAAEPKLAVETRPPWSRPEPGPPSDIPGDVLVLTEMVQEDGTVVSLESQPAAAEPAPIAAVAVPSPQEASTEQPEQSAPPSGGKAAPLTSGEAAVATDSTSSDAEEVLRSIAAGLAVEATNAAVEAVEPPLATSAPVASILSPLEATAEIVEHEPVPTVAPALPTDEMEKGPVAGDGLKKPEIVSEETLAASTAALTQLAQTVGRSRDVQAGPSQSIEELVRGAVEPMLKQWLDANLSRIVERMVREAIDRVVRRVE